MHFVVALSLPATKPAITPIHHALFTNTFDFMS